MQHSIYFYEVNFTQASSFYIRDIKPSKTSASHFFHNFKQPKKTMTTFFEELRHQMKNNTLIKPYPDITKSPPLNELHTIALLQVNSWFPSTQELR